MPWKKFSKSGVQEKVPDNSLIVAHYAELGSRLVCAQKQINKPERELNLIQDLQNSINE